MCVPVTVMPYANAGATMTERYGDFVRYNPPLTGQTLVLWALPVVLLLLMALILWRVRAKR